MVSSGGLRPSRQPAGDGGTVRHRLWGHSPGGPDGSSRALMACWAACWVRPGRGHAKRHPPPAPILWGPLVLEQGPGPTNHRTCSAGGLDPATSSQRGKGVHINIYMHHVNLPFYKKGLGWVRMLMEFREARLFGFCLVGRSASIFGVMNEYWREWGCSGLGCGQSFVG